jgi:hypothetical protein
MTLHMKNPAAGEAAGLSNASLPGGIDGHSNAPEIAPAQALSGHFPLRSVAASHRRPESQARGAA